ncbi:DNA methyltransferase [Escherichia coli]|uniref:DNA methyltransferase n=1 Tax=Escherichia coli TaxID=562 RepID=UPI00397F7879
MNISICGRYFGVTAQVPYTDVWTHKPCSTIPGNIRAKTGRNAAAAIISASSRPGDLVADFFMGSGSTVKVAMALGRRATGVELETERFERGQGSTVI